MGALRAHGELEPQRTLLAETYGIGAAGLTVEAGIAMDLGVVFHQVARTVRAEGLFVGDAGEREPALKALSHAV